MSIKLSYIIPVYGVEKSISACLDSIYAQGLQEKDFEVICVDDCTLDKSCEIIKCYQQTHANLILLHHDINKKAGGARNSGLQVASGKYIWFVDSDDTLVPNVATSMLKKCEDEKLDVLCFNIIVKSGLELKKEIVFKDEVGACDGITFLNVIFGNQIIYHLGYPYRCLYKRENLIRNSIRFPEGMLFGEDTTFMAEAICAAKRVACIPTCAYYYVKNPVSSSALLFQEMRGELIYQSCIQAGDMVVHLCENVRNSSPKLAVNIEANIPWFVNRLFIRLVKTNRQERRNFYDTMEGNIQTDNFASSHLSFAYMDAKNRFVVKYPSCGIIWLNLLSVIYKMKHGIK